MKMLPPLYYYFLFPRRFQDMKKTYAYLVLEKQKNVEKNHFYVKKLKLIKNLCIFKLLNFL